jgi:hypothetical protein
MPELEETRVVDPNTGGEKGSKLAMFSLIPSEFLWALAEHYGTGAKKYTKSLDLSIGGLCHIIRSCTCHRSVHIPLQPFTATDSVEAVMKKAYDRSTLSIARDSEKIVGNGQIEIELDVEMPQETTISLDEDEKSLLKSGGSQKKTSRITANFADQSLGNDHCPWITITQQDFLEVFSANSATLLSVTSKTVKNYLYGHLPTCKIPHYQVGGTHITQSGKRNWERGYAWSLTVDAMERHWTQFKLGERIDPETGSHHLVAAAWHCIALFIFDIRGIGTNDIHLK